VVWWSSEFSEAEFGRAGGNAATGNAVNRRAKRRKWPVLWQFGKQKWRKRNVGAHVERGRSGTLLLRSTPCDGA
jgi:hypothetical protein